MDPFWPELVKQVPNLGALIWMVVYFLKHIRETAAVIADNDKQNMTYLAEVIDRNTNALDRTSEALGAHMYAMSHDDKRHRGNGKGDS